MNRLVRMPRQQAATPQQQDWDDGSGRWGARPSWCSGGDSDDFPPPWRPQGWPPPGSPPWFGGPPSQLPWYPGANAGVSFGSEAPSNPVRGHFWWDGSVLWLFDGAAWVASGGATPSGPATPPQGSAPANPVPGQQWFDGKTLWIWDGKAWVAASQTKTYIQSTAPPAPNPGDTWFNGTQFYVWDGVKWEVVGPGAAAGPVPTTQIQFAMQQTTTLTIPGGANAWGIVPYSATPQVDLQGAWNSTTHTYTPKVAGMYGFNLRGIIGGTDGATAIVKNDGGTFTGGASSDIVISINSGTGWNSSYGMSQMNGSSDFVRVWARDTTSTLSAAGSNPVFNAVLFP